MDFMRKHRRWQAKAQSFAKGVYDMKSIFGCSELDAEATETYAGILFNLEPGLRDLDYIVGIHQQATEWRARFMGQNHATTVRRRMLLAMYKEALQYEADRRAQPRQTSAVQTETQDEPASAEINFVEAEKALRRPEIQDHKARKGLKILRDCRAALKIPVLGSQKPEGS